MEMSVTSWEIQVIIIKIIFINLISKQSHTKFALLNNMDSQQQTTLI